LQMRSKYQLCQHVMGASVSISAQMRAISCRTCKCLDVSGDWSEAFAWLRVSNSSASQHAWRGRPLLLIVFPAVTLGLVIALTVLALRQRHQDTEMASWRRLVSCTAFGLDRVSCGPNGANEAQCRASGCCYDGNVLDGAARCFQADSSGSEPGRNTSADTATFWGTMFQPVSWTPTSRAAQPHWKEPVCSFPDEEREDCGWDGVLDWQCERAGCCYGEPSGPNLPFCYHGKDLSPTTMPPSPTTTLFVLPTLPPLPLPPTTVTATTTTTKTGGSGFKEDDDWFTVLDALGAAGFGSWGFRIVPLLVGALAACLVGALITGLLVGCGRCRGAAQASDGAYDIGMLSSPDYHGNRLSNGLANGLANGPRRRSDSLTGGSYQGLNPHSRYETLQSSPDGAMSWTSSQVQNPV